MAPNDNKMTVSVQKFGAKSEGKRGPLGHVGGMEVGGQMKRA